MGGRTDTHKHITCSPVLVTAAAVVVQLFPEVLSVEDIPCRGGGGGGGGWLEEGEQNTDLPL